MATEHRPAAAEAGETGPSPEVLTAIGARVEVTPEVVPRPRRFGLVLAALLVLGVWSALSLWNLGAVPFHTKGEPREALVVWEMTHGGSWVLPYRNGTEVPSKPPLFHWTAALIAQARGALDETSIRLPSALAGLLGAWLVLATGAAVFGLRAGLFAALVLLTSFEWARYSTMARVDMVLTFGLTLSFVSLMAFLRDRRGRWLVPLYLGIALAVLGKGPVGVALPGLTTLALCLLARDVTPLQQMRLWRGAIAVLLLGGSWYALAYREGGYDFFYKQVLDENLFRFIGSSQLSGGHRHSVFQLYGLLLLGLMPWTLLLPAVLAASWRRRSEWDARKAEGFLLLWIVVVLGFYALPASKRSVYLLPLYPAVALLVGQWLDEHWNTPSPSVWLRRLLVLTGPLLTAIGVLLLVVAALVFTGLPVDVWLAGLIRGSDAVVIRPVVESLRAHPEVTFGSAAGITLAGAALFAVARRPRPVLVFACLFVASFAANVFVRQAVLPGVGEAKTVRDLMRTARAAVEPGHTLFFYDSFDYGAVFYWDGRIPVFDGLWPNEGPRYVLTDRRSWKRDRATSIHAYEPLRSVDGRILSAGKLILLERIE